MKRSVSAGLWAVITLASSAQVLAAADLQLTDRLTWDVVGLDSNDELNSGPDTFAVGYRVCNAGDQTATDVASDFKWDSPNPYINLSPGTSPTVNIGQLAAGECYDVYYNVLIDRDDAARQTTRRYHIEVSATGLPTVTTPIDAGNYNEIYVEDLISQNRNSINSITGPGVVYQGQTYTFVLSGRTATQGYEQLESFIDFPSNIFRVISVQAQYSAPVNPTVSDRFYADSCGWEHDPESPDYFVNGTNRACSSGDKSGGNIVLTYQIEIIGTGNATVTGLIYDFSGSSFHYNTDYGTDVLSVEARALPSLSISDASQAEGNSGTSQLSFTVSLNETKPEAITFDYTTSNGTASSGTDYTASSGTVTVPANTLAVTVDIPVVGDLEVESDEQFTLAIVGVDGATISDGVAIGTIVNDDDPPPSPSPSPLLTIDNAETEEGSPLVFVVRLSHPSPVPLTLSFEPADGTAGSGDYEGAGIQVDVPPGQTVFQVSVPTLTDQLDEPAETISLALVSVDMGTLGNAPDAAEGVIHNVPAIAAGPTPTGRSGAAAIPAMGTWTLVTLIGAILLAAGALRARERR